MWPTWLANTYLLLENSASRFSAVLVVNSEKSFYQITASSTLICCTASTGILHSLGHLRTYKTKTKSVLWSFNKNLLRIRIYSLGRPGALMLKVSMSEWKLEGLVMLLLRDMVDMLMCCYLDRDCRMGGGGESTTWGDNECPGRMFCLQSVTRHYLIIYHIQTTGCTLKYLHLPLLSSFEICHPNCKPWKFEPHSFEAHPPNT